MASDEGTVAGGASMSSMSNMTIYSLLFEMEAQVSILKDATNLCLSLFSKACLSMSVLLVEFSSVMYVSIIKSCLETGE